MVHRLIRQETVSALIVLAAGVLLHFVYQWSGENSAAAVISSVNESVWEHMKLLFVPAFLLTVVQMFLLARRWPGFLAARAMGVLLGIGIIPVLYYTYLGAWGKQITWFNIAIYAIAVLAAFLLETRLRRKGRLEAGWLQVLGLAVLLALAVLFVLWTYEPPRIPLFQDPRTLTYGIRF